MKFTKKSFNSALANNDRTKVWQLVAIDLKRTPTRKEVCNYIEKFSFTMRDYSKAYALSFGPCEREKRIYEAWRKARTNPKFSGSLSRDSSLQLLRELLTEQRTNYTKVPMMGHTHLYFCSPIYGHRDYNKICACKIDGNENFCRKICDIAERHLSKAKAA